MTDREDEQALIQSPGTVQELRALPPDGLMITGAMVQAAIEMGPDGRESLKFLLEQQREERARYAEREFAVALAAFQAECPTIATNRQGAHGVRYADREQVMHTIQPILSAHGFSVTYGAPTAEERTGEGFAVVAIVRHVGGHSERTPFTCPREAKSSRMNASQAEGSASEYAQRYALKLALNLRTGDRDDDAAAAGHEEVELVTVEQADTLRQHVLELFADPGKFLASYGVDVFGGVPAAEYVRAMDRMKARREYLEEHPHQAEALAAAIASRDAR